MAETEPSGLPEIRIWEFTTIEEGSFNWAVILAKSPWGLEKYFGWHQNITGADISNPLHRNKLAELIAQIQVTSGWDAAIGPAWKPPLAAVRVDAAATVGIYVDSDYVSKFARPNFYCATPIGFRFEGILSEKQPEFENILASARRYIPQP